MILFDPATHIPLYEVADKVAIDMSHIPLYGGPGGLSEASFIRFINSFPVNEISLVSFTGNRAEIRNFE